MALGNELSPRPHDLLAALRRFRYAYAMNTFVRAVVSGFAFTLGATLFRKVAKRIGLDEEPAKKAPPPEPAGEAT